MTGIYAAFDRDPTNIPSRDEYAEDITRLDHADDVGWIEDDDDDPWDEDNERWMECGCPYCFCGNLTENGEVCNDCLAGAHQG